MTSFNIHMRGDDELVDWLRGLPDFVQQVVSAKLAQSAQNLSEYIKNDKLSGQILQSKSGALRNSIYARIYESKSKVFLAVGSRGIDYAAIQEFGGTTRPHLMEAKGKVMAFYWYGKKSFFRYVSHPGSHIPSRSYIESALQDKWEDISSQVEEAVKGTLAHG